MRTREYGWTTQKVFHLLNFVVHGGDDNLCFLLTNDRILCFFFLVCFRIFRLYFSLLFWFLCSSCGSVWISTSSLSHASQGEILHRVWRLLISNISYLLILEHYNIFSCTNRSQYDNIILCYRVVLVCFLMHPKVRFCIGFDAYSSPIFHACHY